MAKRRLISFDWAMKKLLRSKANFEILEGFLSELLRDDIRILEILESESNKEDTRDKFNRVDLKVRNQKNEIIVIEVQYERELDYLQRILFGTSKVITEHLGEGDSYSEIVKVISVNILYFDLGHGEDYVYHGSTTFKGIHHHDILELSREQQGVYEKKELSQVFPEYYLIKVNSFDDIAKDTLDEWIYFLKNEEIKEEFSAKGLAQAKSTLDVLKLPEQERAEYERYQDNLHYRASMVHSSYHLGIFKGVEQGRAEGRAEGEQQKALEIARNLIDVLDDQTIAEKTGLHVEDVARLRQELS
ncbi:MAG: Rpn family recombination-promoting nuclease/putative transposase [Candidatus Electrothrix sp. LOE2]|nr:Rpn family recombination-promoting nuclease/putative transposase [Candidatus Electrothrix sp. LOE2]